MKNSNKVENQNRKGLFLLLINSGLVLLILLVFGLGWLSAPRMINLSVTLFISTILIITLVILFFIIGILFLNITSLTEKRIINSDLFISLSVKVLFPVSVIFGQVIGIKKDRIRESFVAVNNSFLNSIKANSFNPEDVLLLLPHCLQNSECNIRITYNITNCINCGKCNIGEISELVKKYKIKAAIATGGTLARKIVSEVNPKLIVAVACHRDLVEGMIDVFPTPVFGLLNERPFGPCVNTKVATIELKKILEKYLIC